MDEVQTCRHCGKPVPTEKSLNHNHPYGCPFEDELAARIREEQARAEKAERERDERRAAQSHALKLIELRTQERDACVRMLRQAVQICDTTNHDFPDWEDEARRLLESLKGGGK